MFFVGSLLVSVVGVWRFYGVFFLEFIGGEIMYFVGGKTEVRVVE